MQLAHIICGQNKEYRYIELINNYSEITGEAVKHFCCSRPCGYVLPSGACHVCDLSDIVRVDMSQAVKSIGDIYKIPFNALEVIK